MWNGHAVISYSSSRDHGRTWTYGSIALREPFHLSYPYIFQHDNTFYMIPETNKAYGVRLYVATHYPDRWSLARVLLAGRRYVDTVMLRHGERWWIFSFVERWALGGSEEREGEVKKVCEIFERRGR